MEDDEMNEHDRGRAYSGRGGYPRFASFFTIAVAILLLFGAASRLGKIEETAALFGIDTRAENRIRHEEQRLRTALTLGAQPLPASALRPPLGRVEIDQRAMPPSRGEFDLEEVRGNNNANGQNGSNGNSGNRGSLRPTASIVRPSARPDDWDDGDSGAIDTTPFRRDEQRQTSTYVVAKGDNWYKIATRTLGDGKRWKEIQKANPGAKDGLRVGMVLKIPN